MQDEGEPLVRGYPPLSSEEEGALPRMCHHNPELAAAVRSSSSTPSYVPSDHRLTSCPAPLRLGGSRLLLAMALSPEYESRRPPEVEGKLLHQQAGLAPHRGRLSAPPP